MCHFSAYVVNISLTQKTKTKKYTESKKQYLILTRIHCDFEHNLKGNLKCDFRICKLSIEYVLQKFWWNVHYRTSRLYSVYICLIQPCNTDLWLMCIVWVCVYFYLLSPFSILCSSYKRPLNFNNCLQFGKILMATSRICIVLCSLQGLQPDTLYFKAE